MSVESVKKVNQDTEVVILKKTKELKEKATNLLKRYKPCSDDKNPGDVLSKKGVFFSTILKNIEKIFDDIDPAKSSTSKQDSKSIIEQYFQAYTSYKPDSWDESLNTLWNSDAIKVFLKSQAITNAGKEHFKHLPDVEQLQEVFQNTGKENEPENSIQYIKWYTDFITDVNAIKNPFNKLTDSFDQNEEFNNLIEKIQSSTEVIKRFAKFREEFHAFEEETVKPTLKKIFPDVDTPDETTNSDTNTGSADLQRAQIRSIAEREYYAEYHELFKGESALAEQIVEQIKEKLLKNLVKKFPFLKKEDLDYLPLGITEEHLNKYPLLVSFARSKSLSDEKEKKQNENFDEFINFFVAVQDGYATKSEWIQENPLQRIENILNAIEKNDQPQGA